MRTHNIVIKTHRNPRRSQAGVTLLELVVAVTIFSMVIASLFAAFRTGVKASEIGTKRSEGSQGTRFVIAQLSSDLRNVFYKTPAAYNITRRQREAVIAEREKNALRSGRAREEVEEDESLPELGPKIDLAFRGTDGGELDALTFIRRQGEKVGSDRQPWGLARVHYYISEGALWRAMEDVTAAEQDEYGNDIPKAVAPRIDKLVDHVTGFDIQYGYYGAPPEETEADWGVASDWDSDSPVYRNPPDEDLDPDDSAAPENAGAVAAATPAAAGAAPGTEQQTPGQTDQNQPDDLPAWVDITFKFADPVKPEKETMYRQIVQLTQSQETYVPPDPNKDDQRGGRRADRRSERGEGRQR